MTAGGGALSAVHMVVDGLNVIGSRPDRWWRDRPGAMRELVTRLEAYAEATGRPVTVVFEGEPPELPPAAEGQVTVTLASGPGPGAADDEIVELVAGAEDPSQICVVTSDRELAERVRAEGVAVMPAGSFRHEIDRIAREARG